MTSWTRLRVASATRGSSLSTREAVRRLTPAPSATSRKMLLPPISRASLGRRKTPGSVCAIDGTLAIVVGRAIDGKTGPVTILEAQPSAGQRGQHASYDVLGRAAGVHRAVW